MLRGVGTSLALPLLQCMLPVRVRAAPSPRKPRRSLFVYFPNGVNTLTWQITRAGKDYVLPQALAALESYRDVITPISGLHHPHALGHAHECEKIWLTGADLGRPGGFRNSVSVDQRMAEEVGPSTRHPSLELAVTGGGLAWSNEGVAIPAERQPRAVFQRLFGPEDGGIEARREHLRQKASVLDRVLDEARRLRRSIGGVDRLKLDEYLEAVREVERRIQRAEAWLDVPRPSIPAETEARLTRPVSLTRAGETYRTFLDLAVLALQTDQTRVITCITGTEHHGLAIPEINVAQTRHELSHHNGDPDKMQRLTRCDTFLVEQLAYLLHRLQSLDEQGESLLDRTLVLFGSGMSYGHSHGNANLPLILAGGAGLGMRHGKHLDYNLARIGAYSLDQPPAHYQICLRPVDPDARLCDLLLTMLQQMGVEADRFGDSRGPMGEIVG